MKHSFDEEYFLRGVATGRSNYTDYRWLPELTLPLAERIISVLGMRRGEFVLDYGCSRGYLVRALRERGMTAYGVDISQWAIANCDPEVVPFVSCDCSTRNVIKSKFHWVVCKDVLEHVPPDELPVVVRLLVGCANRGGLLIVPLVDRSGVYVAPQDRLDKTHLIRWTLSDWIDFVQGIVDESGHNSIVSGSYAIRGIKELTASYPRSTGFIFIRRL